MGMIWLIIRKKVTDFVFLNVNVGAIVLNVQEWLFDVNLNKTLTYLISLLAIIWWLMKLYDQYVTTKHKKEQWKKELIE